MGSKFDIFFRAGSGPSQVTKTDKCCEFPTVCMPARRGAYWNGKHRPKTNLNIFPRLPGRDKALGPNAAMSDY